jgi:hypothetical protein
MDEDAEEVAEDVEEDDYDVRLLIGRKCGRLGLSVVGMEWGDCCGGPNYGVWVFRDTVGAQ